MDGFKLSFYNRSLKLLCIHNRKIAGIEHKVVGNYYFWMWIAGVWLLLCNRITFMWLWLMRVYIYSATSWLEALYSQGYGSFWDWQNFIFLNIILLKKNRMEFEGRKLRSCSFVQFCLNSQSLFYHIHLYVLICYQLHNISLQGEVHYMFHQMKIHIILY